MASIQQLKDELLLSFEVVKEYEVKKGDTLNAIGVANKLSVKLIRIANPRISDVVFPGDILLLPFTPK
jgi:LysM repeat protein